MSMDHRKRYLKAAFDLATHDQETRKDLPALARVSSLEVTIGMLTITNSVLTDMLIAKGVCTTDEIEGKLADMIESVLAHREKKQ